MKRIIKHGNVVVKNSNNTFTVMQGMVSIDGSFAMSRELPATFDLCGLLTCLNKFDAIA